MFDSQNFGSYTRQAVFRGALVAMFLLLFARLVQLQVLYHQEFGKKSEENSVRAVIREPIRGYMYDRNGRLIVDVGPAFTVTVTPAAFDAANVDLLASLLKMNPKEVSDRIARGRAYSRFSPTRIKRDVDFRTLSAVEEHLFMLPGVDFQVESKRLYSAGLRGTHLFGYVREISDAQLARAGEEYRQGDLIGWAGLEARYEQMLRGKKGYEYHSVNALGQLLGSFEEGRNDVRPREGFDLLLTLDSDVQALAERLMEGHRGALVAIDPASGGILALVSKPDFDPEILSGVTPVQLWQRLNNDPAKPLFNRATMTRYPPGSTFKMVLAAAALQEGIIDGNTRINCTGGFRFGTRVFKDLSVHGSTNVVEAIQRSCNVFFYQLILRVGLDTWARYARMFGFGSPTQIDIGEETAGLIPDTEYFNRVYGKGKWTQGYLISLGIGQGEVGVSPLQMASFAAAVANGGTLYQPHAVAYVRNKESNHVEPITHGKRPVGIKPEVMALIQEGMMRVVQMPGGTGGRARIPGIVSAGKTGTAENPHGADHAWYIGYAPFEKPTIAVAVMLENAGFGGAIAAPIAGYVMERYIYGKLLRPLPQPPRVEETPRDTTQRVTQLVRTVRNGD